jgi:hypothetical protein
VRATKLKGIQGFKANDYGLPRMAVASWAHHFTLIDVASRLDRPSEPVKEWLGATSGPCTCLQRPLMLLWNQIMICTHIHCMGIGPYRRLAWLNPAMACRSVPCSTGNGNKRVPARGCPFGCRRGL